MQKIFSRNFFEWSSHGTHLIRIPLCRASSSAQFSKMHQIMKEAKYLLTFYKKLYLFLFSVLSQPRKTFFQVVHRDGLNNTSLNENELASVKKYVRGWNDVVSQSASHERFWGLECSFSRITTVEISLVKKFWVVEIRTRDRWARSLGTSAELRRTLKHSRACTNNFQSLLNPPTLGSGCR